MQDVVDHLLGAAHDAAVKLKTLSNQWATKAPNHPWLRTLQNHDPSVIRTLTHMAVDVYNDSKLLTSAAWSWPSRSLSQLHAEEHFIKYTNDSPEDGIKFSLSFNLKQSNCTTEILAITLKCFTFKVIVNDKS